VRSNRVETRPSGHGRWTANHLDYQLQLDAWFEKANARTHKTLSARPVDRRLEEPTVMRSLTDHEPGLDRRWVVAVVQASVPLVSLKGDTYRLKDRDLALRPGRQSAEIA
jgi:hypothetical protein